MIPPITPLNGWANPDKKNNLTKNCFVFGQLTTLNPSQIRLVFVIYTLHKKLYQVQMDLSI